MMRVIKGHYDYNNEYVILTVYSRLHRMLLIILRSISAAGRVVCLFTLISRSFSFETFRTQVSIKLMGYRKKGTIWIPF